MVALGFLDLITRYHQHTGLVQLVNRCAQAPRRTTAQSAEWKRRLEAVRFQTTPLHSPSHSSFQRHARLGLSIGRQNLKMMHASRVRMLTRPDDLLVGIHLDHRDPFPRRVATNNGVAIG